MFNKLRTVIYHVDDISKAKEWYQKVTGKAPYFDEPFYVGFDFNHHELGLDPNIINIKKGNNTVAYWAVDDIQAAVKTFTDNGAKLVSPVTNVGGTIEVATVEDPFGNAVGLITGA